MNAHNPYEPPRSVNNPPATVRHGNPLLVPAIVILVSAVLYLIYISSQFFLALRFAPSLLAGDGLVANLMQYLLFPVLMIIGNLIAIRGGIQMLRREKFDAAQGAAVVACIPFCSPGILFGIPFGIWALVLMKRADVRAMFADQRTTLDPAPRYYEDEDQAKRNTLS